MDTVNGLVGAAIGLTILGCAYMLPTIIAAVRGHRKVGGVAILNVLAGWTFIGWIAALYMSVTG